MNPQDEAIISCPYCGESFSVLLDLSIPEQTYIEDCYVCCRPITIHVTTDAQGEYNVTTYHEDESF